MNSPARLGLTLALILLSGVAAGSSRGAERASAASTRALQRIERSSAAEWKTRWDEAGTPSTIFGSRSTPLNLRTQDVASAVRGFLLEHADLFRMRPGLDDYRVGRQLEMNGVRSIRMQQVYRGVPVYGTDYTVTLDHEGCIRMIAGHSTPDLDLDVTPSVSATAAGAAAVAAVPFGGARRASKTELVVYTGSSRPRLAYRTTVVGSSPGSTWEVLVDASTTSVLEQFSRVRSSMVPATPEEIQPRVSSHRTAAPHGGPVTPVAGLGNAFNLDPRDPLLSVALRGLTDPGTALRAETLVVVHNAIGADAVPVGGVAGDFRFSPSDSFNFAQAHVYYHVDRYFNYVRSLGFPAPATPLVAYTNVLEGPSVSWYDPDVRTINFFRRRENLVENVAYDARTIYHETQHFVTDQLTNLGAGDAEVAALDEGISEYMAASMADDPVVDPWLFGRVTCADTCHFPPRSVRNSAADSCGFKGFSHAHFDHVNACGMAQRNPHTNGLIIAGGLWDMRQSKDPPVGKEVMDRLVLQALAMLPWRPSFGCFWDALWTADGILYGLDHMFPLVHLVADRYLQCKRDVQLQGPDVMFVNQPATFSAGSGSADCPIAPFFCFDYYRRPIGGPWTQIGDCNPDPFDLTASATGQFDLRVIATDVFSMRDTADRRITVYYPLTASVDGPSQACSRDPSRWCAVASGHRPFSYVWRKNSMVIPGETDSCVTTTCGPNASMKLRLDVTDADGQTVRVFYQVDCRCEPGVAGSIELEPVFPSRNGRAEVLLRAGDPVDVKLEVYDVTGRWVAKPFAGKLEAGDQTIQWSADGLRSGLYFYRLSAGGKVIARRFEIIR